MVYLGLDIGDKRIGISVSTSGIFASGVETYYRTSLKNDCQHILELVKKYNVDIIVAGLPKHLNGDNHQQAEKNEVLCSALREQGCKIDYFDERLTSAAAEKAMLEADLSRKKRKENIDKLAAVIILQDYLDTKGGGFKL
ncbi:MAG: Holliday junction resolvase RuvX [Clostridiales bacterium]|nr:Holliday junction resolvase RuvX [Clostridiales bacterium]